MTGIFNSCWGGGSYSIKTNRHACDRERIWTEVLCTLAHKWLEYLFTTLRDMKGTMVRKTVPFWGATSLNEIDHTIIPFWVLRTNTNSDRLMFQFNMVTFDDKWRDLMTFRDISWHLMIFGLKNTLFIMTCHDISDSNPYSGVELRPWTFQWDLTL